MYRIIICESICESRIFFDANDTLIGWVYSTSTISVEFVFEAFILFLCLQMQSLYLLQSFTLQSLYSSLFHIPCFRFLISDFIINYDKFITIFYK